LDGFGREVGNGDEDGEVQAEPAPWSFLDQFGVEVSARTRLLACCIADLRRTIYVQGFCHGQGFNVGDMLNRSVFSGFVQHIDWGQIDSVFR
jgi:hypothetical protein